MNNEDTTPQQSAFLQGPIADKFLLSTRTNGLGTTRGVATVATFTSTPCVVATIVIIVVSSIKCRPPRK